MTSTLDPAYIIFGVKHSGKTTQGRLLAKKLSFSFVDIDEIITKQTGFTPRQIYFDYGPEKVMSAEEKICSVLEKKCSGKKIVIATGGGICDNAPALMRLRDLGIFIFLEVSEQTAFERILEKITFNSDGSIANLPAYISRKNPKTEDEVKSIFHDVFTERTTVYQSFVDIIVPLANVSPEENFQTLCAALGIMKRFKKFPGTSEDPHLFQTRSMRSFRQCSEKIRAAKNRRTLKCTAINLFAQRF